jgi:hypothetical protein
MLTSLKKLSEEGKNVIYDWFSYYLNSS